MKHQFLKMHDHENRLCTKLNVPIGGNAFKTIFLFETSKPKTLLFMLALLCVTICSFSQVNIKGTVEARGLNVPSATVCLLNSDSALLKKTVTDSAGAFAFTNIAHGKYFVTVSVVGYSPFVSTVTAAEKNILQNIQLEIATADLGTVVVKSEKPLFEQQIDRLVINVQNSVSLSGNTMLEILQKLPGVSVNKQENNIAMYGKSGVRIMLNGKLMQLPLNVVMNMLEGMSGANIEKIELITTPPSKYDAEGNAGIINIITKQNTSLGTNGSVGFTLGYKWAETLGTNFNLSHRSNNFAYFLNYSVLRNHNLHIFRQNRRALYNDFVSTVTDYSHRENITTQQNLNAGIEWKLGNTSLLTLGLTGFRSDWELDALNNDINNVLADSTLLTNMKINESNIWQSAGASLGFQTKINNKSDLNTSVDYLHYNNENPSGYNDTLFYPQHDKYEVSQIDLKKNTPISFIIGKADYTYNVSRALTIETGLKGVLSKLNNDVLVQKFQNNEWIIDSFFTSNSTLDEQIAAAYFSTKLHLPKQWEVNTGLRYEYDHTALSALNKNIIDKKYGYLFPTVFVKKSLDAARDVQFSYSKRITRPTYNDIAPYVFFWGPTTFSSGNTALVPAIAEAVKTEYHQRQWVISLEFTHSKNEIVSLQPELDSQTHNLIYRAQNLKYLNTLGLANSLSFKITTWWKLQTNITAQYQVAQTMHLQNNTKLDLYGVTLNVVNSIKLPKDFSFEVSGFYKSRSLAGISEHLPIGSLNAAIQKKFGQNGALTFAVDDMLHTNYWKIRTSVPENNLYTSFIYDFHERYLRLTYSINFGNNKLQSVKLRSGSEEERERLKN
jgi:hypothetical protein